MEIDFDKTSESLGLLDSHHLKGQDSRWPARRAGIESRWTKGPQSHHQLTGLLTGIFSATSGLCSKGDIELKTRGAVNKEGQEYSLVRSNTYL